MYSLYSVGFGYMTVTIAIIGSFVIAITGIHSIYHEQRDKIGNIFSRSLSIIFFIASWMVCIGYAFFRTDLVFAMGPSITCHFGFYLTTNSVFISKISLFTIFLYRIHLVFGSSVLRYSSKFLKCVLLSYVVLSSVLNVLHISATFQLVHLIKYDSFGLCSVGDAGSDKQQRFLNGVLLSLFFGDVSYSIFVCCLFVYKLRIAINAIKAKNETHSHRKYGMILLVRKQTILVIVACFSSLLVFGISSQIGGFGLLIPLDSMTNAICVWFMYSFNQNKWKLFITYVCCCCYLFVYKEELKMNQQRNVIEIQSKSSQDYCE